MEEARESLGAYGATIPTEKEDEQKKPAAKKSKPPSSWSWQLLGAAFMTTFLAEMGDRTQIAMIGQSAAQPLIPVMCGGAVAFLQLTAIAVLTGSALQGQGLKERSVLLVGALSFAAFAVLTLRQALMEVGLA